MVELLEQLRDISKQVASQLDEIGYEELELFVEERERLITLLKERQYNGEYPSLLQEIQQFDGVILSRMRQLKDEAQTKLQEIAIGKRSNSAYNAGYTPESIYFDKRR